MTVKPKLSAAMEDYLKAIFQLQDEGEGASTVALAARLGVAAPSVTSMLKRLHELGLILHTPYRGVELTPAGHRVALEVVRHHRLLELYLTEFLDVPWDQVHREAERLEHVLSEDLEERIAAKLGQPTRDPHGDPIPSPSLSLSAPADVPLSSLEVGQQASVIRVPSRDPALLRYLGTLGLVPGTPVVLETATPFRDVLTLRVGEVTCALGSELARWIRVLPAAQGENTAQAAESAP